MRIIIQKVNKATVFINKTQHSAIQNGLLCFVGFCNDDDENDFTWSINKIINLKNLNNNKTNKFELLVAGDYLVADKYSETLKNQEQLIENLTRKMTSQIKRELSQRLNDS